MFLRYALFYQWEFSEPLPLPVPDVGIVNGAMAMDEGGDRRKEIEKVVKKLWLSWEMTWDAVFNIGNIKAMQSLIEERQVTSV